jgi:hypothetical protein
MISVQPYLIGLSNEKKINKVVLLLKNICLKNHFQDGQNRNLQVIL